MSSDESASLPRGIYLPAPVAFSGFLAGAWRLLRTRFRGLFLMWFCLAAVCSAVEGGAAIWADSLAGPGDSASSLAQGIFLFPPLIAWIMLGTLAVAVSGVFLTDRLAGQTTGIRDAFSQSRPLLKELLAAGLLATMISLFFLTLTAFSLYFLLFLLPLFFGPPIVGHVIAIEGMPLQLALGRARKLLRGNALRLLGYTLCLALLSAFFRVMFASTAAGIVAAAGDGPSLVVGLATRTLYDGVSLAFIAAALLVAYLDCRARAEQFGPEELRAERAH